MRKSPIKPLRLRPLGCGFSSRPLPESIPDGIFRLTQNMRQTDQGAARFPGWTKFLSGFIATRAFVNEDLSDQLLSLQQYYAKLDEDEDDSGVIEWPDATYCSATLQTRSVSRQPVTLLAEVTSSVGSRHIIAGTQTALYELMVGKGNWRILRDGIGGIAANPGVRTRISQVGDFVLCTNNYDPPFSYTIGNGPHGCGMNSTDEISELEEMGITKALVTFQYRGILFLCNTEEDGVRRGNMIRWCGADPTNWIEEPGFSLAGHFELDFGEDVLAAGVIGDFAYIHTTRGTWQVSVNPDPTVVFNFQKIPGDDSTQGCIAYPHTFVSTGDSHFYMAKDGIYEFTPSYPVPQRVEWIHGASNVLYDNLNKSRCAVHTAGFDPINQEMYFSCAQGTDSLPSVTLYCNTRYNQCSKLDFGATAFLSCTPSNSPSYRDWLVQECICTEAALESEELQDIGFNTVKEGAGVENTPSCASYPTCIYTTETTVVAIDGADSLTMEDFNQETASANSVCEFIDGETINDLCLGCQGETKFAFAHASDYCIKELGTAFSREMYSPTTDTYSTVGYLSRMLKVLLFGSASEPKTMTRISLEHSVADEVDPLDIYLRVGRSIRVQDPLDDARDACQIHWGESEARKLECVADDRFLQWPVYIRGECLFADIWWNGKGGDVVFSSFEASVMADLHHV